MKRSRFRRLDRRISCITKAKKTVFIASNNKLGISIYMDIPKYEMPEPYFRVYNNVDRRYASRVILLNSYDNAQIPIYFLDKPNTYPGIFVLSQAQVDWINKTVATNDVQYTLFGIYAAEDRLRSRYYSLSKKLRERNLIESLIYWDSKYYIKIHPSDIEKGLESFKVYDKVNMSKMCRISIRRPEYIIPGDDYLPFWNLSTQEKKEISDIITSKFEELIDAYNNELTFFPWIKQLNLKEAPDYTKLPDLVVNNKYPNSDILFDIADGESSQLYSYTYYSEINYMNIAIYPNEDKSLHYFVVILDNGTAMKYEFIRINMDAPEYMDKVKSKYRKERRLTKEEVDELVKILNYDDGWWWQRICDCYNELTYQNIVFEKPDYTKLNTKED